MSQNKIVLAGGNGFIGSNLAASFIALGWRVVILTRRPKTRSDGVEEFAWDGRTQGPWATQLNSASVVVNLAGRSINCLHTPNHRNEILESRISSVQAINQAIAQSHQPPAVLIQSSAVGIYGNRLDECCTEDSSPGFGFIPQTVQAWEGALLRQPTPSTRQVILRIGLVLGRNGGLLEPMGTITRWGLGGSVGSGRQWMSWIHILDIVGIIRWVINESQARGVFLATAPNPLQNRDFMRLLRRALHRPWSPPAPSFAVRLGSILLGTQPELALEGCRCIPQRLMTMGFQFQYPELETALKDIYGKMHQPGLEPGTR